MQEIFIDLREFSVVPNFQNFDDYDKVVLGHRTLLGSNISSTDFDKLRCLYDETQYDPIKFAANYKSTWLSACSKDLETKIENEISYYGLSPLLVRSFFFYLLDTFGGCFDAAVFAQGIMNNNSDKKITIAFGGTYLITEIVTIIWWLKLSKFYSFNENTKVTFEYYKKNKVFKTQILNEALELAVASLSDKTEVECVEERDENEGDIPTWVICAKWCKDKDKWIKFIRSTYHNDKKFLIIEGEIKPTTLNAVSSLTLNNKIQFTEKNCFDPFTHFTLRKDTNFNELILIVENFVVEFGIEHIARFVKALSEDMNNNLDLRQCENFFIADVPSIESIATHQVAIEKNKLPILLPHSFSAAHEIDIRSYNHSYTYFSSKYISPHARAEPDRIRKELVFNVNNYFKGENRRDISYWGSNPNVLLKKIRKNLNLNFVRRKFVEYLSHFHYTKDLKRETVKFGYIANAELDQFNNNMNFKKEITFLIELNEIISQKQNRNGHLFIRGKKSYFPIQICKKAFAFQKSNTSRSPSFDLGITSLEAFGGQMFIVFFIANTSAILQLMLQGVLCIRLRDESVTWFVPDYVEFPADIVPTMTLLEFKAGQLDEIEYLEKMRQTQYEWANNQVNENQTMLFNLK